LEVSLDEIDLSQAKMGSMKYVSLTTVDAERSISMHKAILSNRRKTMSPGNLEMLLVCHFEI